MTTAQLETPGFLSAYKAVVVSRYDASFGTSLSALAASNIAAYVGSGASQGGVAVFTNDASDNLFGSSSGDPYDSNIDRLFVNAVTYAAASGHGYVGEFNGAVMAMSSNSAGWASIGLLPGSASAVGANPSGATTEFNYGVGPIGSGNAIDAGVTFPFTDADQSTYLTQISGADPSNIVDVYTDTLAVGEGSINGLPAVLANSFVIHGGSVPDSASSLLLVSIGVASLIGFRRRKQS